ARGRSNGSRADYAPDRLRIGADCHLGDDSSAVHPTIGRAMTKKHRQERQARRATSESLQWLLPLCRGLVLGGGIALIIISALIPSEASIPEGTYAWIAAGWCVLLLTWAATLW